MRNARAGPADLSSEEAAVIRAQQERWREPLVRVVSRLVSFAMGAAAVLVALEPASAGGFRWSFVGLALLAPVSLIPSLGMRVRVMIVLAVAYGSSIVAMLGVGFMPNISLSLCTAAVLATLLLGLRFGLGFLSLSAATLCLVAWLFGSGALTLPYGWQAGYDVSKPLTAARLIVVFSALTAILMSGVHFAVSRAEAMLAERSLALQALERETREKARIEAELKMRDEMVRRASEMELLGRLAGFAAHDVNNALLVIQASVDVARDDLQRVPAAREVLDTIGDAADTAAATMRQLRAFGRGGTGAPGAQSVTTQLTKVTRLLRHLLPPGVRVETDFSGDATIFANESEFQRVVLNLALNARDAMPEGGVLTLRAQAPDPVAAAVTIEVCDTGSGMDVATLAQVFQPFFTTKGASGSGLGLASVRDVVEAHGGEISVRSALGVGTTFSMRWPLFNPNALSPSARVAAMQPARRTVLLVDDDAITRRTVGRMLELCSCDVLAAPDGAQALLSARRHRGAIDVLLTDCVMPGMPVQQLIASFRKAHPGARVIMSSGHTPDEIMGQGLDVDVFLPKPFARADLLIALGPTAQPTAQTIPA